VGGKRIYLPLNGKGARKPKKWEMGGVASSFSGRGPVLVTARYLAKRLRSEASLLRNEWGDEASIGKK